MNAVAAERMENFAREVLKLSPEMQVEFFNNMVASGLMTADEAEGLKQYVALYHMFTDQRYYKAIEAGVLAMYAGSLCK